MTFDGVYDGYKLSEVEVTAWDSHPSVLAHNLIAQRLYHQLVEKELPVLSQGTATETRP